MTTLQFIASLVSSLAWPVAAFGIAALFRSQIKALLNKLRTLSFGGAQADFTEKLDKLEVKAEVEPPNEEQPPELVPEPHNLTTRFDRLLEISPAAAILESWNDVEEAAMQAAHFRGVTIDAQTLPRTPSILTKHGVIDSSTATMFSELRSLRNLAAHSNKEISVTDALRFQELASKVLRRLRSPK
jgi:uncharacterized protein YutE (UPF0331/DUF86 family)